MDDELANIQALWNQEYNKLFRDLGMFIKQWITELKKCKCDNIECQHYQKEKWKRYGARIDGLFNSSLMMNAQSFIKVIKEN